MNHPIKRRSRRKFIIAGAILLVALGLLTVTAFRSFFTPTYTISELLAKGDSVYGKNIQLEGRTVETPEQLKANYDISTRTLSFTLADRDDDTLRVRVQSRDIIIPDTFWNNPGALVEGIYGSDGILTATTIFTKCPSKYIAVTPTPVTGTSS